MNIEKKIKFHILRWASFLVIPVSILYDEYINQQKLSEQKTHLSI